MPKFTRRKLKLGLYLTFVSSKYLCRPVYTYPSLCVGDTFQKNTTQIETTLSGLRFSIANHVKFEDLFQGYKNTTLKRKWSKVIIKKKTKITFQFITYNIYKQKDTNSFKTK